MNNQLMQQGLRMSSTQLVRCGTAPLLQQSSQQLVQARSYWQEIVRRKVDKEGNVKYDDPSVVVRRFKDSQRADGHALLDLHLWNERHEKKWMKKQRLIAKKRYEFDKQHVMNLAKYIEFIQDNKDKK
uniref:Uncharacterized protein n=1 Tax=Craspedostauros australis TaxID=1486917 RepID=A0A7R9ZIQ2_9STRA|mmetsp:Transcript_11450/g.31720  ORF Transcript_11450/g.31720 Transcript_11450/m.31720 type:complete len:128 (+) Transcript_11450:169-552(+)|eukprot:CAMPEP_0198132932 /NCGR_PEP_ID=MMETSP1442-20131203/59304_1 /TAXON_ID= /ORGANISM="Craspedostauros australis, Strain CCMP3328" /LENGTH=127 /DNA_ID=CAMNT_0043794035 /DNA_START=75 /DNA_END=458 /DNA_ORIENTATION=+